MPETALIRGPKPAPALGTDLRATQAEYRRALWSECKIAFLPSLPVESVTIDIHVSAESGRDESVA